MPITPFLHNQPFDPEALKAIGQAFDDACRTLGLADRDDELVARQIIELAQTGVRTPTALYMLTVKEFAANP